MQALQFASAADSMERPNYKPNERVLVQAIFFVLFFPAKSR
jgi:hypothetical protein